MRAILHLAAGIAVCMTTATAFAMDVDEHVNSARADLAKRLDIPEDGVQVESARQVQWRSGAMGCPKKGMQYTQVVTPGFLIILEAGGDSFRYHAGMKKSPFLCPRERSQRPVTGQGMDVM